jgi:hypothetical protein
MDIDGDGIESDGLEMELDTGDKEAEEEGGRGAQTSPRTTSHNPAPPASPLLRPAMLEPAPICTDAPNVDDLDAHHTIAPNSVGAAHDNPDTTTHDHTPAAICAETADAIPDAPDITVQHPSATSTPPSCPPRAAEWFSHALSEVMKVNLGAHFNALLEAWTRTEVACKFENAKPALPKKIAPSRWIVGSGMHAAVATGRIHPSKSFSRTNWSGGRGGTACSQSGGKRTPMDRGW